MFAGTELHKAGLALYEPLVYCIGVSNALEHLQ
jgi:hypothetical protein